VGLVSHRLSGYIYGWTTQGKEFSISESNNTTLQVLDKSHENRVKTLVSAINKATEFKNRANKLNRIVYYTGADPEVFVENEKGETIPAFVFLPDKKTPIMGAHETAYWDGVQAEFTIFAGSCHQERTWSVRRGLNLVWEAAKKLDATARLSCKTVIEVDDAFLQNTDPKYLEFGCAPSLNAYGLHGKIAEGPITKMRCAGGHIHFSYSNAKYTEKRVEHVKWLDRTIGLLCVCLLKDLDNPIRREYYGLPGEYRETNYSDTIKGVEYRTLSNGYLCHPTTTILIYDVARNAMSIEGTEIAKLWNGTDEEVIEAIRDCNAAKAKEIILRNEEFFLLLLTRSYLYLSRKEIRATLNAFLSGIKTIVKSPEDVVGNWDLEGLGKPNSDFNSNKYWTYQIKRIMRGEFCV